MEWKPTSKSLPPVGEEVLVFVSDIYAVAHIDESPSGAAYWDSDSDIIHGCPVEYVSHWCSLSPPTA